MKKNRGQTKEYPFCINQQLAKTVQKNDLLMAFDGNSLCPSAMLDSESHCPRNETGYLFIADEEKELIQQFNNRTFTQFKDQAYAPTPFRCYNPKCLKFQL